MPTNWLVVAGLFNFFFVSIFLFYFLAANNVLTSICELETNLRLGRKLFFLFLNILFLTSPKDRWDKFVYTEQSVKTFFFHLLLLRHPCINMHVKVGAKIYAKWYAFLCCL